MQVQKKYGNLFRILGIIVLANINLRDAAKYYKEEPHQVTAWEYLQRKIPKCTMDKFAELYRRKAGRRFDIVDSCILDVPYFYQRDSKTGHGERMCYSSSMAMVIEYYYPNKILDDDEYLEYVLKYGDTTSASAQKQALEELGVGAVFHQDGTLKDIDDLVEAGHPVPLGILHRGDVTDPIGGGHWIVVVGHDKENYYVHDPFGKLDLQRGGYNEVSKVAGRFVKYDKWNLMKRWNINSTSDGWYWDFSSNEL